MSISLGNVNPSLGNVNPQKKTHTHFEGLDFLRAFFSVLIVALHSNLLSLREISRVGNLYLADILAANVAYLAVPVFFQISLFLFYVKSEKVGSSYFIQKRLPKLISLYLFWVTSKIIFDILLTGNSESLQNATSSAKALIEFIISGGNSPLYFFFSLAFIAALTEVTILCLKKITKVSLKKSAMYILLTASCILVFIFAVLRLSNGSGDNFVKSASSFAIWAYNPLNFLPYIFTTAIVVQEFKEGKIKSLSSELKIKLCVLLLLFIMFTILEWSLSQNLLHYSRLSLVFGSWLLLYLALLSTRKAPSVVQFISGCSLGIYTFHLFFTHGFFATDPNILTSTSLASLVGFLIALGASILLTLLFRKVKFLKGFV